MTEMRTEKRTGSEVSWTVLVALVMMAVATPAAAEHVPPTPDGIAEFEAVSRLFLRAEEWNPMIEVAGRFEDEDTEFRYRSLTAGTYYRIHRNVKVGAFYRLQFGARHDDDWVLLDEGVWEWRDTTGRAEHVLLADVTPRFLLEFLPGENWVFGMKNRYAFNTFNSQQTLLARPQLTYFWLRNRRPVLNVTAAYGLYGALNFSDQLLYKQTPYLDAIIHLGDLTKLNVGIARKTVHWASSEDIGKVPVGDYSVDQTSWLFTAGVIFITGL
jgi:hypothetical protein